MSTFTIQVAARTDAERIVALVNRAYRGDASRAGWTTEADLLEGVRTTLQQVTALMAREDTCIFTGMCDAALMATLCAEWHSEQAVVHLGMIAVEPTAQNRGYGKQIIMAAEQWSRQHWGVHASQMVVVSVRQALIDFYQRLGYTATGDVRPFPVQPELWQAKVEHMQLITLQKDF